MNVAVIGAGAWGSALAKVLHENGNAVTLWDIDGQLLADLRQGRSPRYLPGVSLPTDWRVEEDWDKAVRGRECLVFAVPSTVFRKVAARVGETLAVLISVTKGIELDSDLTMTQVLQECFPKNPVVALSGPSFAREVALGIPTSVVCASDTEQTAKTVQGLFHRPEFRTYRSADRMGVELGGALKNVMAIGAGVGDGLGYGDNAKAAMVSRALAEIRRLGLASGAQAETFAGLSGIGDLMLTCFSRQSRNRDLGERLGLGETIEDIIASHPKLAEGYPTARSAFQMARRLEVDTPIIDEVHAMLYEGKPAPESVRDLLRRGSKAED